MTRYEEEAEVYELYMNGRGLDTLIVHDVTVREGMRDMQQVYGSKRDAYGKRQTKAY